MKTYIGVMLAAALMLPAAAGAQEKKPFVEARGSVKPVPLPPGGPAPRMSDGHVDLSGNWFPGPTGKANAWSVDPDPRVPEDPVPFQPWAEAKIKAMSRVDLELSSANVTCDPVGTPGMFVDNAYMHLIDMMRCLERGNLRAFKAGNEISFDRFHRRHVLADGAKAVQ